MPDQTLRKLADDFLPAYEADAGPVSKRMLEALKARVPQDQFKSVASRLFDVSPLDQFRAALNTLYGPRLERVVLFGSRARADAREDSDYAVAVFLKNLKDRWSEIDRLTHLSASILHDTGAVIDALPFEAGAYRERTPLMHEIRREGLEL